MNIIPPDYDSQTSLENKIQRASYECYLDLSILEGVDYNLNMPWFCSTNDETIKWNLNLYLNNHGQDKQHTK
uniref:Uncharacterized protein n=1 Tax=Strongyloides papillosus TaxID=174720 RepID=A0A0N5CIU4_STREA